MGILARRSEGASRFRPSGQHHRQHSANWTFGVLDPPYTTIRERGVAIPEGRSDGDIVICRPTILDPERCCADLDLFRFQCPLASLVVQVDQELPASLFAALLSRVSRHGAATVVMRTAVINCIGDAVQRSFDPEVDPRAYLRVVLPLWPPTSRDRAAASFLHGFRFDPEVVDSPLLPRRQEIWRQVGRALAAARLIQGTNSSLSHAGLASSYADVQSMNRSLVRTFGVSARDIRGTVGWEWLVWRFLSGLRRGKGQWWDVKQHRSSDASVRPPAVRSQGIPGH
jgi:AraC-like DNA-binding protein